NTGITELGIDAVTNRAAQEYPDCSARRQSRPMPPLAFRFCQVWSPARRHEGEDACREFARPRDQAPLAIGVRGIMPLPEPSLPGATISARCTRPSNWLRADGNNLLPKNRCPPC